MNYFVCICMSQRTVNKDDSCLTSVPMHVVEGKPNNNYINGCEKRSSFITFPLR